MGRVSVRAPPERRADQAASSMKPRPTLAVVEAALAITLWAISFIFMKIALRELAPATIICLRFGTGALVLGLLAWRQGLLAGLTWSDARHFAILGAVGITLQQLLQVSGQKTAEASVASFLAATAPAFTVVLATLLLRERLTRLQVAGVVLASLGSAVVATNGDVLSVFTARFGAPGNGLVLLSAIIWSVFTLMNKNSVGRRPAVLVTAGMFFFGWLFELPFFIAQAGWRELPGLSLGGWGAVAYVSLLSTVTAYLLNSHALQQIPAARVAVIQNVEPLIATTAAVFILGEVVTPAMLVGGAGILVGVYLAERGAAEIEELASEAR
jgi:drug/metabolite transporter (DMT)-like permease